MDGPKTILIIEDDPGQQKIYTIALERVGYNVIVRGEAYAGLRWLEQILPDLILLDIMLPGLSGLDMLREIRSHPNGRDVPIVVATASGDLMWEDFDGYNIAAFLHKPLMPSDLVNAVQAVLTPHGE